MESNIKGLVAAGHEMASELKAECGAVDMRSVAKLISDLATQLEVQLVRANALAEDQQKAIESIKQADAAVKLAHEKFSALAAENAGLKSGAMDEIKVINRGGQAYCVKDGMQVNPMYARGWNDYRAKSLQSDTPAIHNCEQCGDEGVVVDEMGITRCACGQAANSPATPDAWISCSERMPEETGDIIVVSDGIVMSGISYSRRDGFYIAALEYDDDEPIDGVTHWMPLPEPPQEVK
ncbi:TPA: DUF551 domain-containing protein [Escherichia coli]